MRDTIKRWQIYCGDPRTGRPYTDDFYLISNHPNRVMHPLDWNRVLLRRGTFVDLPHLSYVAYFVVKRGGEAELGREAREVGFQTNSGRCRGSKSLAESARIQREAVREAEKCQAKKGL